MSPEPLSRRSLFGRLFGAAALLIGAGPSAGAALVPDDQDLASSQDANIYTYDRLGRVMSIAEGSAP